MSPKAPRPSFAEFAASVAVVKCAYKMGGHRCQRWATDWREVPLRVDPPGPDSVEVPLCDVHVRAVTVWADAQRLRAAKV